MLADFQQPGSVHRAVAIAIADDDGRGIPAAIVRGAEDGIIIGIAAIGSDREIDGAGRIARQQVGGGDEGDAVHRFVAAGIGGDRRVVGLHEGAIGRDIR
jgi:hypothetical protein